MRVLLQPVTFALITTKRLRWQTPQGLPNRSFERTPKISEKEALGTKALRERLTIGGWVAIWLRWKPTFTGGGRCGARAGGFASSALCQWRSGVPKLRLQSGERKS